MLTRYIKSLFFAITNVNQYIDITLIVLIIWTQADVRVAWVETRPVLYVEALDVSPACSAFPPNRAALKGQAVSWLCIGTQSVLQGEEGGRPSGRTYFRVLLQWSDLKIVKLYCVFNVFQYTVNPNDKYIHIPIERETQSVEERTCVC